MASCQGFHQYANIRPVRLLPGTTSPLRSGTAATLNWVVVRDNTEGEYAGLGGRSLAGRGPGKQVALQTGLFTEEGCERIMRFAFHGAGVKPVQERQRHLAASAGVGGRLAGLGRSGGRLSRGRGGRGVGRMLHAWLPTHTRSPPGWLMLARRPILDATAMIYDGPARLTAERSHRRYCLERR